MIKNYKPCLNECSAVAIQISDGPLERVLVNEELPSILCPIFACICCCPLGIGAIASYLDAKDAIQVQHERWFDSSVYYAKLFSIAAIVLGTLLMSAFGESMSSSGLCER